MSVGRRGLCPASGGQVRVPWCSRAASPRAVALTMKGDGGHGPQDTPAATMSPATSAQVRRRQAARRNALARQKSLNEERRRRDELEIELAADFALANEECAAAREAIAAAELAMGLLVERMIGELRVRYPRAAQLLAVPEDELRRLRQLTADSARNTESTSGNPTDGRTGDLTRDDEQPRQRTPTTRGTGRARRQSTTPHTVADGPEIAAPATDAPVGHGGQGDLRGTERAAAEPP